MNNVSEALGMMKCISTMPFLLSPMQRRKKNRPIGKLPFWFEHDMLNRNPSSQFYDIQLSSSQTSITMARMYRQMGGKPT
jgi:hypothetical protein